MKWIPRKVLLSLSALHECSGPAAAFAAPPPQRDNAEMQLNLPRPSASLFVLLISVTGCATERTGPIYTVESIRPQDGALAARVSESFADSSSGRPVTSKFSFGHFIAIGDNDTARLAERDRIVAQIAGPQDQRLAAAADVRAQRSLGGWDIFVGRSRVLTVRSYSLLAASASGRMLAVSSPQGTEVIRLRDKQVTPVVYAKTKADSLALSEDGDFLLASFNAGKNWVVVRTDTGMTEPVTTTPGLIPVGVQQQGGKVLVLHLSSATAEIRDTAGAVVHATPLDPTFPAAPAAFWSPAAHTVIFAEAAASPTTVQRTIMVWNYLDGRVLRHTLPEQEIAYMFGTMLPAERATNIAPKPRSFDRPTLTR